MTTIPPAENPQQDPSAPAPVVGAAELAVNVQTFWEKNRAVIIGGCVAGIAAIVAIEGWRWRQASRDESIRAEFAQAGTDATKLGRFAAEHSGHPLAGAAQLILADQKFESGDFKGAADGYAKALAAGDLGVLAGRARLGEAVSKLQGGDGAGGEAALAAVSADTSLPASVRAEATFHRATLALAAGKKEDAVKLANEIKQIEPAGRWAMRAESILVRAETGAAAPAGAPAGDSLFKPGGE
ncbi:MAG TPA: tetratricopeptide repeat protein [Opitutaceae bacterium]|nr:tetratricopeptide repeat protein [Opitutaceae bacterium]